MIDYEADEGVLFQFTFFPISDDNRLKRRVYARNKASIELFAKQHGFDCNDLQLDILDAEECIDDESLLKIYRFKSNCSDNEYNIMTCTRFIDKALGDAAQDLVVKLWFDDIIMRHDIEFIKMINHYIYQLNHVFIMNNLVAEDFWDESNKERYAKSFRWDDYVESNIDRDSEYVLESLVNHSIESEVQPITIESYIKSFTEILTETFNDDYIDFEE